MPSSPRQSTAGDDRPKSPFTPRERRVLRLLDDGYTVEEIAEQLFISTNTVRIHLANIRVKLGLLERFPRGPGAPMSG